MRKTRTQRPNHAAKAVWRVTFGLFSSMIQEHCSQHFLLKMKILRPDSIPEFSSLVSALSAEFDYLIGLSAMPEIPEGYLDLFLMIENTFDINSSWSIRRIHSLCTFLTRTGGDRPDLETEAFQKFLKTTLSHMNMMRRLLIRLQRIC